MYRVIASNKFKKDFKLCLKRGLKENCLEDVLYLLEKTASFLKNTNPTNFRGNIPDFGNVISNRTGC